jgi:type I restriction enzyme M protein
MTLEIVRAQWQRVVFMQPNREDVGRRYLEIEIPIAPDVRTAAAVSEPFRRYYTNIAAERGLLRDYLRDGGHHFFLSGAEEPIDDAGVELDAEAVLITA